MKLRNAILALGFAIAFTFGSFALNANIDSPVGIIEHMVIDSNNNLSVGVICDETARLTISNEDGTTVYSAEFTASSTTTINTRNWENGTYIAVLVEDDGSVATAVINI